MDSESSDDDITPLHVKKKFDFKSNGRKESKQEQPQISFSKKIQQEKETELNDQPINIEVENDFD